LQLLGVNRSKPARCTRGSEELPAHPPHIAGQCLGFWGWSGTGGGWPSKGVADGAGWGIYFRSPGRSWPCKEGHKWSGNGARHLLLKEGGGQLASEQEVLLLRDETFVAKGRQRKGELLSHFAFRTRGGL